MIAYLNGRVLHKNTNSIILLVDNLGYRVQLSERILNETKLGQEKEFFCSQQFREDSADIYGFDSPDELDFFELLLSISGIGPKSALGILNVASPDDVKQSIVMEDQSLLIKVAGVGKKTAARLILELKSKIAKDFKVNDLSSLGNQANLGDEMEALLSLGYQLAEIRQALNNIDPKLEGSSERIKAALKILAKKN